MCHSPRRIAVWHRRKNTPRMRYWILPPITERHLPRRGPLGLTGGLPSGGLPSGGRPGPRSGPHKSGGQSSGGPTSSQKFAHLTQAAVIAAAYRTAHTNTQTPALLRTRAQTIASVAKQPWPATKAAQPA
jgi:hypothetical protein